MNPAKRAVLREAFKNTKVAVVDPTGEEYKKIVDSLGGAIVTITQTANDVQTINPLEIPDSEKEN